MIEAAGTALRLVRIVPGAPELAFRAWTEPELMARWMTPIGVARASVDLRVGGGFRVTMRGDGREIEHDGEYLEVDPPRRLRFTWRSPYTGAEPSEVTVELEPVDGGTRLTVVHRRLPPGAADAHAGGWGAMVDRLGELLAEGVEA